VILPILSRVKRGVPLEGGEVEGENMGKNMYLGSEMNWGGRKKKNDGKGIQGIVEKNSDQRAIGGNEKTLPDGRGPK